MTPDRKSQLGETTWIHESREGNNGQTEFVMTEYLVIEKHDAPNTLIKTGRVKPRGIAEKDQSGE